MARVLIASDKFKGSLSAAGVAAALGAGIRGVRPDTTVVVAPVADGGEGTLEAALASGHREVVVTAAGPTGVAGRARYARSGDRAVIELAEVCGLGRLPGGTPAPLRASSRGVGEVIAAAVADGCRHVVLGVGGSASTDGGAGMVAALGARLLDGDGREVRDGGGALGEVRRLDLTGLRRALAGVELVVACDVTNPLTGPTGAAAVYGPQKGASPADVAVLDAALAHWADLVADAVGADGMVADGLGTDLRERPGAGAAGGVGFAAMALLGARLRSGAELVLELAGFGDLLRHADLVVTGEGSLDEQSLQGKAPVGVATAAGAAGVPVVAVCGRSTLDPERLRAAGFAAVYRLTDLEPDPARCMTDAAALLGTLGALIATDHLAPGAAR